MITEPEPSDAPPEVPAPLGDIDAVAHEDVSHITAYARPGGWVRLRRSLSFSNASSLYVFAVLFAIFSVWIPNLFLTSQTFKTLLDQDAVTALLAIGLLLPLAAGVFDLSIGSALGVGMVFVAWLLEKGFGIIPSVLIALMAGAAIGSFSGFLVVRARIDSFIATLAISSILVAMSDWISGGQQILGLSSTFQNLTAKTPLGVAIPVYVMLVMAIVVWYILERTPTGRRIYATGGNPEAARLTGVRTPLIIVCCLAASAVIAVLCGLIVASQTGAGDPTVGPSYLLPAFSAAFLGSTQFKGGRFNVWGTVVSVYVLGMGVQGLELAGAPTWLPNLFNGTALIIAVGLAKHQRAPRSTSAIRRLMTFRRATQLSTHDTEVTK